MYLFFIHLPESYASNLEVVRASHLMYSPR